MSDDNPIYVVFGSAKDARFFADAEKVPRADVKLAIHGPRVVRGERRRIVSVTDPDWSPKPGQAADVMEVSALIDVLNVRNGYVDAEDAPDPDTVPDEVLEELLRLERAATPAPWLLHTWVRIPSRHARKKHPFLVGYLRTDQHQRHDYLEHLASVSIVDEDGAYGVFLAADAELVTTSRQHLRAIVLELIARRGAERADREEQLEAEDTNRVREEAQAHGLARWLLARDSGELADDGTADSRRNVTAWAMLNDDAHDAYLADARALLAAGNDPR